MRVLVTGADGFVGRHLCRHLLQHGHTVLEAWGPRGGAGARVAPNGALPLPLHLDLTEPAQVLEAVAQARPDGVIHLAGFSSVARSHADPMQAFRVNALGTAALLGALREKTPRCRVVLVGSGEMYGALPPGQAAREEWPLLPSSPYAASKVSAEVTGFQFWRSYGLPVVSARPFNHLGAGQASHFVVPAFASQLSSIRRGEREPVLKTGNLEPIRDFSHVLDVVEAYTLLLEKGEAGSAYNVGSGAGRSIASLLQSLLTLSGVKAKVETDASLLRPVEIPSLVGDATRLRALGWRPHRTVEEALREVLEEQGAL